MSGFYGINSDSVSTLFGSLGSASKQAGTQTSGSSSVLSQYASIRSGSYYKLLKAYYNKYGTNNSTTDSKDDATKTGTDTKRELTAMKSDASDLTASAEKLYTTGTNSVFNKKLTTTTDEKTGVKTTGYAYDMDQIYKSVKAFADDYNSVLDSAGDAENKSVLRSAVNMTTMTKKNEDLLEDIGIKIGDGNKLSVDEKALKAANVSDIKSLFNGAGSYAYNIAAKASNIQFTANSELSSGQLYGNTGNYSAMTTGKLYDSLF